MEGFSKLDWIYIKTLGIHGSSFSFIDYLLIVNVKISEETLVYCSRPCNESINFLFLSFYVSRLPTAKIADAAQILLFWYQLVSYLIYTREEMSNVENNIVGTVQTQKLGHGGSRNYSGDLRWAGTISKSFKT